MHPSFRSAVIIALLLAAGSAGGCATRAAEPTVRTGSNRLAAVLDSIADAPPLHRTHWGMHVVDAATGRVLYSRNAERNFITASNMKLVVGVVALGLLGPDYRYRTPLLASGRGADTAAVVIVAGSGDPTWSARFHGDAGAALDSIAARIAAAGLARIRRLVVDATRFRDELVHPAWEVGDLPWQFAPPIDAVAAGEGVFRLVVSGGATPGAPATAQVVGPLPQPLGVRIRTDTAGAAAAIAVDYTARRDTVFVRGSVGAGAADTSTLALTNPAWSAGQALADALRRRGVTVGDVVVARDTSEAAQWRGGAQQIGEVTSPPMHQIVAAILRPSQNWIAEQVLKTLGAEGRGEGTWRGGVAVERAYLLDVVGVDTGAMNLRDASGLSAQNLLTPGATVALLLHAGAQPWGGAFRDALAAPGLAGSTLSNRLQPLAGRLHAKTGTISNVNSLSGYLTTSRGREIVFSILTNASGQPSSVVRQAIDALVLALARELDG